MPEQRGLQVLIDVLLADGAGHRLHGREAFHFTLPIDNTMAALHGRRAPARRLDDEDALRERSSSQMLLALVMVAWSLWYVFES